MIACASLALVLHLASHHFGESSPQHDQNPGIGLSCSMGQTWTVEGGEFTNSAHRDSEYLGVSLGRSYGALRADLFAGGSTGYPQGPVVPLAGAHAALSVTKGVSVGALLVPHIPGTSQPGVIHFQIEVRIPGSI
jgi:hypothetical protein